MDKLLDYPAFATPRGRNTNANLTKADMTWTLQLYENIVTPTMMPSFI